MTIVFGSFVTTFNDFTIGKLSPDAFRSRIDSSTYVELLKKPKLVHFNLFDFPRLWFVYLFIGKLTLTYAYTVFLSIAISFAICF